MPDNDRSRPARTAPINAAGLHRTASPERLGRILDRWFDDAVGIYFHAVDAEQWSVVWAISPLIVAIHDSAEQVAA